MNENDFLAQQFEANRPHLRAVAYRILGNAADVDDVLQDAWLRVSTTDTDDIANIAGWLTTVVARICLNTLRARQRRPAQSLHDDSGDLERLVASAATTPEEQAVVADSMGVALLIVLETLSPAERIAFVLHDMFGVSFDEIAEILGQVLGGLSTTCEPRATTGARVGRTGGGRRAANDEIVGPF